MRDRKLRVLVGGGDAEDVIDFSVDWRRRTSLASRRRLIDALVAMVYVHPCNCGDGIPDGKCARCRSVAVLGFDPAALAGSERETAKRVLKATGDEPLEVVNSGAEDWLDDAASAGSGESETRDG